TKYPRPGSCVLWRKAVSFPLEYSQPARPPVAKAVCIYACRKFLLTPFSASRERNMIVIAQPNATEEQIQKIVTRVREFGLEAQISRGASRVIIGVIGPEA